MPRAYIFMNMESRKIDSAAREASRIEYVQEARLYFGVYDAAVLIDATNLDNLKEVVREVRRLDGINSTLTVVEENRHKPKNFMHNYGGYARARMLINTEIKKEESVANDLLSLAGPYIKDMSTIYGVYNITLGLEAFNHNDLKNFITWKVRRTKDIRSTMTLIESGRYIDGIQPSSNFSSDARKVVSHIKKVQNQ